MKEVDFDGVTEEKERHTARADGVAVDFLGCIFHSDLSRDG